jgi:hypothetical protein
MLSFITARPTKTPRGVLTAYEFRFKQLDENPDENELGYIHGAYWSHTEHPSVMADKLMELRFNELQQQVELLKKEQAMLLNAHNKFKKEYQQSVDIGFVGGNIGGVEIKEAK